MQYNIPANSDTLITQENACYEVVCTGGKLVLKKRGNATSWESQTTGCRTYSCDNASGEVWRDTCDDGNGVKMVCESDTCKWDGQLDDGSSAVIIEVEAFNGTGNITSEIMTVISIVCGINAEQIRIGVELDNRGQVSGITVIVNDEGTAHTIADAVNGCVSQRHSNSTSSHEASEGDFCNSGILRYATSARVVTKTRELSLSGVSSKSVDMALIVTMILIGYVKMK